MDSKNTVIEYQNQRTAFMKDSHDSSMLAAATEELQQSFVRQQERLRKHNLQIEIQEEDVKPLSLIGGEVSDNGGEYIPGCFQKKSQFTTKYRRNYDEVATFQDNVYACYYVMETPPTGSKLSSVDVIYERMTYDRSKEYMDSKPFNLMKVGVIILGILMVILWMLCITAGVFTYLCFFGIRISGWAGVGAGLCFVTFKGSMALTGLYEQKLRYYQRRRLSRSVVESIRKKVPDFCMEKFVALMDSRLKQMIYAENREELGTFLDCNVEPFLQEHENVVHMERTNFWFEQFHQDNDYLYLVIRQRIYMAEDKDNAIIREFQDIRMRLIKPIAGIMSEDFYQDWYITNVEVCKEMFPEAEDWV